MISLNQKNKRFCSEQCDLERIQPALLYAASPEVAPNSQKQPGKDDLLALWVKSGDLKQKYKPYFQEKSIHEDDLSGPGQGGGWDGKEEITQHDPFSGPGVCCGNGGRWRRPRGKRPPGWWGSGGDGDVGGGGNRLLLPGISPFYYCLVQDCAKSVDQHNVMVNVKYEMCSNEIFWTHRLKRILWDPLTLETCIHEHMYMYGGH